MHCKYPFPVVADSPTVVLLTCYSTFQSNCYDVYLRMGGSVHTLTSSSLCSQTAMKTSFSDHFNPTRVRKIELNYMECFQFCQTTYTCTHINHTSAPQQTFCSILLHAAVLCSTPPGCRGATVKQSDWENQRQFRGPQRNLSSVFLGIWAWVQTLKRSWRHV